MAISQLSVFVGNNKGSIADITDILATAGINLHALNVADTDNFGILRLIADNTENALAALAEAGVIAKTRQVVCFEVPDEPGGLSKVLRLLADHDINTEYMYSLISGTVKSAYIVIRVGDNERAEQILTGAGYRVLTDNDVAGV